MSFVSYNLANIEVRFSTLVDYSLPICYNVACFTSQNFLCDIPLPDPKWIIFVEIYIVYQTNIV